MKLLTVILLICCISSSYGHSAEQRGRNSSLKVDIIGGDPVLIKFYPFMAYLAIKLKLQEDAICSATILSVKFLLTAGHCLKGTIIIIHVSIGSSFPEEGKDYYTKVYHVHPSFKPPQPEFDIGLVEMTIIPMKLDGTNSKVVTLSDGGGFVAPESTVSVLGWGRDSESSNAASAVLRMVSIPVISIKECQKKYKNKATITIRMFCAGYLSGAAVGPCNGDSGGAAINEKTVQVGIVSMSIECAKGQPSVYTDIAALRGYIKYISGV